MKFRSVLALAAVMCLAAPCAATYNAGDTLTVAPGETVTVTDADIGEFNTLASVTFADAAGVLEFNTATPPTVQISGNGTIRKTSSDEWSLVTTQEVFTGTWDLTAGISTINMPSVFGPDNAKSNIYVRSGATLRINHNKFIFRDRNLHLAGDGYQNNGALQCTVSSSTDGYTLHGLVLDDDARISLTNSAFLYLSYITLGNGSLIDLLGHRLTVACDGNNGNNLLYMLYGQITGPGQIVVTNTVSGSTAQGGLSPRGVKMLDPSVEIVLHDYTRIFVYNHSPTNYFAKLTVEGSHCRFVHDHQFPDRECVRDCSHDFWAGEVNLKNPTSRLQMGVCRRPNDTADMGYSIGILGPVTGPGSLDISTEVSYYFGLNYLTCPTNSYTGETVFDGSYGATLILPCSNNIPVYAKAKSKTPITLVPSDEEHGWSAASIARFAAGLTNTGNDPTRRVVVDASNVEGHKMVFAGLADELTGDVIDGIVGAPGTELEFRSPLGRPLQPQAVSNTVTLTGTETLYVTNFPVFAGRSCGGDIVIDGAKDLRFAAEYPFYVSAGHGAQRVRIVDSTVAQEVNTVDFTAFNTQAVHVGFRDTNAGYEYPGDVVIGAGAVVTARVHIAGDSYRRGRVVQTGGEVAILSHFSDSGSGNNSSLGYGTRANGYYDLVDGKLVSLGGINVGGWGTLGTGVIRQRGGNFSVERHPNTTGTGATEAWLNLGYSEGTRGHYMTTGGKTRLTGSVLVGRGARSRGIMTIGGDAEVVFGTSFCYGYGNDGRVILNLNDSGTLAFAGFYSRHTVKDYIGDGNTKGWLPHVFLNANGGRLRANGSNGSDILGGPEITNVNSTAHPPFDRIALYSKGLVIDVSNKWQQAYGLISPATGKGVASIPWTRRERFLVSPWVQIDGDGDGASAIVDVDPETGDAIGVIVTSPGCDYTWAKATIFDRYDFATKTNVYMTVDCTLADNDGSGGLTVEGLSSGTLVLAATNTYRGPTVLNGATLALAVTNAIPVDSTIVLGGGKLEMNGKTLADGSTKPKNWGVDMNRVREVGTVTNNWSLAFPEGATFTVLNADELTESDKSISTLLYVNGTVTGAPEIQGVTDPRWKVAWNGNRIALRYIRGAVMTIR